MPKEKFDSTKDPRSPFSGWLTKDERYAIIKVTPDKVSYIILDMYLGAVVTEPFRSLTTAKKWVEEQRL